jgi:hypothetical protein
MFEPDEQRGLLTVGASAEEWMQRQGLVTTPQHELTQPLTWGAIRRWARVECRNARRAGGDWYDDSRAGYLLDCRRRGEDAEMRTLGECCETWLIDLPYVPAADGPLERALCTAFREGWESAQD